MSTTFYDFIATTAVFRSPASTLLRSLGTQSPCSGSHKCYDVTSTFVVTSPTAPASSVAPAAGRVSMLGVPYVLSYMHASKTLKITYANYLLIDSLTDLPAN